MTRRPSSDALDAFHPPVATWFRHTFTSATPPQQAAWPAIMRGENTLVFAPTGSGKTLSAFLGCIDRVMFAPPPAAKSRCRILYISPLKALANDVERNLRVPLAGIVAEARRQGIAVHEPTVAMRTGDSSSRERAAMVRTPSDFLITTPESLYLMLTSQARETLRSIDTIIIDEIHALVPSKRGAHLMLSIARLEALVGNRVQRIGLSATQRPLSEVARFLGGFEATKPDQTSAPTERLVFIADARAKKELRLTIEQSLPERVPDAVLMDDMSTGGASAWNAIHPKLVELIRAHHSTLVFVNSRRVAERLAAALNELANETLAFAHHGSLAREQRVVIEDRLKAGHIPALVCTSSLELGIDMGSIDLVVQVEAPPSVASALQRVGRAGHQVGAPSVGVIFPKFRGDLLACAAVVSAMHEGEVESTRYARNPLDILSQQIVAMAAVEQWSTDDMFHLVRQAAPFSDLSRPMFDSVLDMLSGRYASDALVDLRARITWDRIAGTVNARQGSRLMSITSGGTIADRGLFPVFLVGAEKGKGRVGELDEEMVFETKPGETFVLGASTWRVEEITHDRVMVTPAPGQPGRMPFWRGEQPMRPYDFGKRMGELTRTVRELPRGAALQRLVDKHALAEPAAATLLAYLDDQAAASQGVVPDDHLIVVERVRDDVGNWRVCILSPLGGEVLAPWSLAIAANVRRELGIELDLRWTNDGIVCRFPATLEPPDTSLLIPHADAVEELVISELAQSAMFAARFRESAARALLLPKRRPGTRAPLWQQRKKAQDLLAVVSKYAEFPILLETYRECLRDVFDMPQLGTLLRDIDGKRIRVATVDTERASPFAAALMFTFTANFIYDGDQPAAERRAQALTIDQAQLRELLGEGELRELFDVEVMSEVEAYLQRLEPDLHAKRGDGVHDLLLRLGDLSETEIAARFERQEGGETLPAVIDSLVRERRVVPVSIGKQPRFIAAEDAGRYRDAFAVALPDGLPSAFLAAQPDAFSRLLVRFVRTHATVTAADVADRFAVTTQLARLTLEQLARDRTLLEGAFRPGGTWRDYADPEVLRSIHRRTLTRLRKAIEPVAPWVFARQLAQWHGVQKPRKGLDVLLDVIDRLQGAPLLASALESQILPARVVDYTPSMLDTLAAAGEIVWVGVDAVGERDGRLALYLTDQLAQLHTVPSLDDSFSDAGKRVLGVLRAGGAQFFAQIQTQLGGFGNDTLDALWELLWRGVITNDTFRPLRAYIQAPPKSLKPRERFVRASQSQGFRSRRSAPAAGEGRWSLLAGADSVRPATGGASAPVPPQLVPSATQRVTAIAEQLLSRHGVLTREAVAAEGLPGGFTATYEVLRVMEDAGRIRRGLFVSEVSGMQFAMPAAVDMLRSLRTLPAALEWLVLAATDPANPYGSALPWPQGAVGQTLSRSAGALVILSDGRLVGYLPKSATRLSVFLPSDPEAISRAERSLAAAILSIATKRLNGAGLVIEHINGIAASEHPLSSALLAVGLSASAQGFTLRRR